jgi:hypothetical protein
VYELFNEQQVFSPGRARVAVHYLPHGFGGSTPPVPTFDDRINMANASDYIYGACEICGKIFDFCLITTSREEAGWAACEKGHNFCAEHSQEALDRMEKSKRFWEDEDSGIEESECWIDDISCSCCPVCNK